MSISGAFKVILGIVGVSILVSFTACGGTTSLMELSPSVETRWQPGLHYTILVPPPGVEAGPERIEIREFFLYTSTLSHQFQSYLDAWLTRQQKLTADTRLIVHIRVPAIAQPHARSQARMFFTIRKLGREDLHKKLFSWVREEQNYATYHAVTQPDEHAIFALNRKFAALHGIDEEQFTETYNSKEIDDQVALAEIRSHTYNLNGTPTVVVNGTYSTSAKRLAYLRSRPVGPEVFTELLKLTESLMWTAPDLPSLKN